MSLRKTFKTDKALETEGVEIAVGINEHNDRPINIRIARMSRTNKKYAKALDTASRPHSASIQNETLDEGIAQKMMQTVFVNTILLGWSNLPKSELTGNDEDTDELPFTRENALALFEELPDLYTDWEKRANRSATFREIERDVSAGN